MADASQTQVLVVSDHPIFRDELVAAIKLDRHFKVSGAGSGDLAEADLYVIDFDLETPDPTAVVGSVADARCGAIVLLSGATAHHAYELIELGARGLTHKSCTAAEIVDAVRRVAKGDSVIPKTLQGAISAAIRNHPATPASLTKREVAILEFSSEGLSAAEIGGQLSLSESSIKSQLTRIYGKLEVSDRTAAVAVALRRSLIH